MSTLILLFCIGVKHHAFEECTEGYVSKWVLVAGTIGVCVSVRVSVCECLRVCLYPCLCQSHNTRLLLDSAANHTRNYTRTTTAEINGNTHIQSKTRTHTHTHKHQHSVNSVWLFSILQIVGYFELSKVSKFYLLFAKRREVVNNLSGTEAKNQNGSNDRKKSQTKNQKK